MYESFYGFRERPFDLTPNPRFLVMTDVHREALGNLEYGIASRTGITLLVGEAGTGKTTLIKTALERQPARVHCVHIQNPALTREEFIEMLALRFQLSERARTSKTTLLFELEESLRQKDALGESTVLLVDEAQSLPREILEEIRLLANIETTERKLLSVILAGQPEVTALLNDPGLRQLKQRIALRCELRPLTLQETAGYLAGRIRAAGGVGAQVFTREAVTLIHESSGGVPRTISVIADNALLTGFALGQRPVNSGTVREVCRDFDIGPGGDETAPAETRPEAAPKAAVSLSTDSQTVQARVARTPSLTPVGTDATAPGTLLLGAELSGSVVAQTPMAAAAEAQQVSYASADTAEQGRSGLVGGQGAKRRLFSFLRG